MKLYEKVANELRRAIALGGFRAGQRLPSTRRLAKSIGVSRNTVLMAYRLLRIEQLTISRERGGTCVVDTDLTERPGRMSVTVAPQSRYAARVRNLGSSAAAHSQKPACHAVRSGASSDPDLLRMWSRKLVIAARAVGAEYPDPQGFLPLRSALADWLARQRGIASTANDILIVRGMQQAITIAARVLLDEGDVAAVEDPVSPRLRETLAAHGARVIGMRTDEHGIVTDQLTRHEPKLICVSPACQFPTDSDLSAARRVSLLQFASRDGRWILEDDSNCEFQIRRSSVPTLRSLDKSGTVIYACTFWQTLLPSLRLGFLVCPPAIHDDLCAAKRLADLGCPLAEQAALAALIRSQECDRLIRRLVDEMEQRRIVFQSALLRHCSDRILAQEFLWGTNLVVWLPRVDYSGLNRLLELGSTRGLNLRPVHTYYQRRPEHPGLILSCVNQPFEALERFGALLGECLDEFEEERRLHKVKMEGGAASDNAAE